MAAPRSSDSSLLHCTSTRAARLRSILRRTCRRSCSWAARRRRTHPHRGAFAAAAALQSMRLRHSASKPARWVGVASSSYPLYMSAPRYDTAGHERLADTARSHPGDIPGRARCPVRSPARTPVGRAREAVRRQRGHVRYEYARRSTRNTRLMPVCRLRRAARRRDRPDPESRETGSVGGWV